MAGIIRPAVLSDATAGHVEAGGAIHATALNGDGEFWRVPVIETLTPSRRHIGFMDFRRSDADRACQFDLVRHKVNHLLSVAMALSEPRAITELGIDEIGNQAHTVAGEKAKVASRPKLIYLDAETRLAWKCDMVLEDGDRLTVLVTPGFAWKL